MKTYAIALTVVVTLALSWLGLQDYSDAKLQHADYCEMLALHKASGGQDGWPDFLELGHTCR